MIVNDTQLAVTLAALNKFRDGRNYLISDPTGRMQRYLHPILRKAQLEAVESVIAELEEEVAEYRRKQAENSGEK